MESCSVASDVVVRLTVEVVAMGSCDVLIATLAVICDAAMSVRIWLTGGPWARAMPGDIHPLVARASGPKPTPSAATALGLIKVSSE